MELDPATEEAEIAEMVRGFLALQPRTAVEENRPLRRGAHAKGVCVRAVFDVLDVAEGRDPALAARLAKGIYVRPGSYPATVRFSNANPNVNGDSAQDVRGLAFCAELAPSGSAAAGARQDYSLQSAPTLPFNDVRALVVFAKVFTAPNQAVALGSLPFRDQLIFARTMAAVIQQKRQPVRPYQQLRYWSAAPFRHGSEDVVKYSASPAAANNARPLDKRNPNALRDGVDPALERRRHDEFVRLRAPVPGYRSHDLPRQAPRRQLLDRECSRRVAGSAGAVSYGRAADSSREVRTLRGRLRGRLHRRCQKLHGGQRPGRRHQPRAVARGRGEPKCSSGQGSQQVEDSGMRGGT